MQEVHDKPFILDNGQIRYLYFSFDFIQSAMRISDPDVLDLRELLDLAPLTESHSVIPSR